MATGYTHDVAEGKVTEFPAFAMQCARAFGALVEMRDADPAAKIPESFVVSDYYVQRLVDAEAKLARLEAMDEATAAAECQRAHAASLAEWEKSERDRQTKRQRYEAMLEKVRAWIPPTPQHAEMHSFMASQLISSIDFDCKPYGSKPEPTPASEWLRGQIVQARQNVAYYTKSKAEEEARVAGRNKWLADLRASLVS